MSQIVHEKVEIRGDVHRSLHRSVWSSPMPTSLSSYPNEEDGRVVQNYVITSGKLRLSLQSVVDFSPKAFSIVDNDGIDQNVLTITTEDGKVLQIRCPDDKSFTLWLVSSLCYKHRLNLYMYIYISD